MRFISVENKEKVVQFFQKYWIPIVGVGVILAVIFSVASIYKENVLEVEESTKYEKQDQIILASKTFDTLNPITTNSEDTYYITPLLYDGLFSFTDDFGVEPDLVNSYTVDSEKGSIDIDLKSNVKFHDGSTLDANDVIFTVNAIKAHGKDGLYYNKASKIRSVSSYNGGIRIQFSNAKDCALDNLTFPIVPSSQYNSIAAFNGDDNFKPIGTGQYKYKSYDAIKALQLVPNDSYYDVKANNGISIEIIPNKSTSSNLVEVGNLTCYYKKGAQRKTAVTNNSFKMYDFTSNEVEFLYFNTESEFFKNKDVRKATAYAINSEEILKKAYMEDGVLSDTIYYPNFMGVQDENKSYKYNKDTALNILKKINIEDRDSNGKLEMPTEKHSAKNPQYEDVEIMILVNKNNSNRLAAAKMISNDLEAIGFSVTVNSLPWKEYKNEIKKKDFDILITGFVIEEGYDLRSFFDGENLWGYENEKLLKKVEELDKLHDENEYPKYYSEVKKSLLDELPYYSLCYKNMGLIGGNGFEIKELPTFNNIYGHINEWEWSKEVN